MSAPILLPSDVVDFLRRVLRAANLRVARTISRMPSVHETSLDHSLIEAISHYAVPIRLRSGWVVRLETHFLGGGKALWILGGGRRGHSRVVSSSRQA